MRLRIADLRFSIADLRLRLRLRLRFAICDLRTFILNRKLVDTKSAIANRQSKMALK